MGLQKYRADQPGKRQANGGMPWYSNWIGGPSLAVIYKCPIQGAAIIPPRTVYVRGEADTFFSIPAACRFKRKIIRGFITTDDNGEYVFHAYPNLRNCPIACTPIKPFC